MDFGLYQAVFTQKDGTQDGWVFAHGKVGQSLLCGDKAVQLLQPGALASSFVTNEAASLNVSSELSVVGLDKAAHIVTMEFRCLVFQLGSRGLVESGVPIPVKDEQARFEVNFKNKDNVRRLQRASQTGILREIEGEETCTEIRKGFKVATCQESLKSVVALNQKDGFELLMVDLFDSQTVIDLQQRMKDECLIDTRRSQVTDCYWTTLPVEGSPRRVVLVTFANGNNASFDESGNQVRLLSDAIFG